MLLPEDFSAFTWGFQYSLEGSKLQLDYLTFEGNGQRNLKLTTRKPEAETRPVSEMWIVNTVDFLPSGPLRLSRRKITMKRLCLVSVSIVEMPTHGLFVKLTLFIYALMHWRIRSCGVFDTTPVAVELVSFICTSSARHRCSFSHLFE